MIISKTKIQVFISSACGDEPEKQKYNYVREALKLLIESTGFAEVYTFETQGASTISAHRHYITTLQDSDVCIFLIDNRDGVSDGVQKEIDEAKKYNKRSLFYFCDQFSKEETPLQKSLKGAKYAKSKPINDFKDFIKNGATDLIEDLILIYKQYCKGRLVWYDEQAEKQTIDIENIELSAYKSEVVKKELLVNIDSCIEYFNKLILEYSFDEEKKVETEKSAEKKTKNIDALCADFLPVLFEGKDINIEQFNSLLLEVKQQQSAKYFEVIQKRYEAIKEYYGGKQKNCIEKLKEALQLAKKNDLDEWIIKDILIDLRNQIRAFEESQNKYSREEEYQQELTNSRTLLYYPLLDRVDSDYYEEIIKETIKFKMQSPNMIIYGNSMEKYIRPLAEAFVLAMYNGSLTHIQVLYTRVKYLVFYFSTRYANWNTKKLLLETTIIDGKTEEIDDVFRRFEDLHSKMNASDAREIYSFADNQRIEYQRVIAKLEAFRVVGYYMDDKVFADAWMELNKLILGWSEGENSIVRIGSHIFSALEANSLRISQDQLIEIVCKCIYKNKRAFYNNIFSLIRDAINFDRASDERVDKLLKAIIMIVKNSEERAQIPNIESALYTLRKKFKSQTEDLNKCIAEEMPNFYNDAYRLETTDKENDDMPKFVRLQIEQILKDNERQGKNGCFSAHANRPHITIKNILRQSSATFCDDLIHSVFIASCETLLRENQTIETKMDAIELLIYLVRSRPMIKEEEKEKIAELLLNKPRIESAQAIMTNLNETNLRFSAFLLYHCVDEEITSELLNALADIGDDVLSNRKASKVFLNYLEADTRPETDTLLEHIILQRAIEWCAKSDLNIRWNAVQILFLLLKNPVNKNIINNQLVKRMDVDNVYIKNKILRNIGRVKDIDSKTFNYIIKKAFIDANYVVRKTVEEVFTSPKA